eukprot:3224662-Amphidinium_carterae.1
MQCPQEVASHCIWYDAHVALIVHLKSQPSVTCQSGLGCCLHKRSSTMKHCVIKSAALTRGVAHCGIPGSVTAVCLGAPDGVLHYSLLRDGNPKGELRSCNVE